MVKELSACLKKKCTECKEDLVIFFEFGPILTQDTEIIDPKYATNYFYPANICNFSNHDNDNTPSCSQETSMERWTPALSQATVLSMSQIR